MKKSIILIFLLIVISIIIWGYYKLDILHLFPRNKSSDKLITICEDYRELTNLPVYLAIEKGFFADEGIEVELSIASQGEEPTKIMEEAAKYDILLCGPEELIYAYQMERETKGKYFYNLSNHEGAYIISRNNFTPFTIQDIKNQTIIGAPRGTLREMVLEKYLLQNNLAPQRGLNIIQTLTAPDNLVAFISGSGNFIYLREPKASQIVKDGQGYKRFSMAPNMQPLIHKGLITLDENLLNNPKKLEALSKAILKAQLWINYQPVDGYIRQIKKYFPEDKIENIRSGIESYKKNRIWPDNPIPTPEGFGELLKVMQSAGEIRTTLNPDDFLESKIDQNTVKVIKKTLFESLREFQNHNV